MVAVSRESAVDVQAHLPGGVFVDGGEAGPGTEGDTGGAVGLRSGVVGPADGVGVGQAELPCVGAMVREDEKRGVALGALAEDDTADLGTNAKKADDQAAAAAAQARKSADEKATTESASDSPARSPRQTEATPTARRAAEGPGRAPASRQRRRAPSRTASPLARACRWPTERARPSRTSGWATRSSPRTPRPAKPHPRRSPRPSSPRTTRNSPTSPSPTTPTPAARRPPSHPPPTTRTGTKPAANGLDAGEFTPTPEFDASVSAGGRYIWSVDVAGTLRMAPARPGIEHPILTEGSPVVGAGEAQINARGIVEYINNHTGHYTPCQACSGEFLMNGVRAFEAAGVPVLRRGITNLGGR